MSDSLTLDGAANAALPFILILRKPMTQFTIYTQQGFKCKHCEDAVYFLDNANQSYSLRPLPKEELLKVAEKAAMTTVPIIYQGDRLIGGCDDLKKLSFS